MDFIIGAIVIAACVFIVVVVRASCATGEELEAIGHGPRGQGR